MDRREFLTTMLQGSLAAAWWPKSIVSFLIAQYATRRYVGRNCGQSMRIGVLGIGQFGACCTRLLSCSATNISCREMSIDPQGAGNPDFSELNGSLQHSDLLFLPVDTLQPSSVSMLTACCGAAAAAGLQAVVIGPQAFDFKAHPPTACCSQPFPPHCTIVDPSTVSLLVKSVADLVNVDNSVGIDHGYIRAVLGSGGHGVFACKEAVGPNRGERASRQALEQLQRHGINTVNCRGAMACIYGTPTMTFDDYSQASTVLDDYFPHDITYVFSSIIDEHLADVIKVAVLAMH